VSEKVSERLAAEHAERTWRRALLGSAVASSFAGLAVYLHGHGFLALASITVTGAVWVGLTAVLNIAVWAALADD
jgi:hypothetical protein